MSFNWKTVCKQEDLIEGVGVAALFEGEQVAIFYLPKLDPQVFAIANWDPIAKANVLSRGIVGSIEGKLVVSSPLYKQHFELSSGQCLEEDIVIPCWQVSLENGEVKLAS
ncbi:nitrite reductase [NAD(P)H], small subunit [Marinomonas sp. MED121]|uniref:nitrite reductase small subunit NirD n=1 Tax=Marinomonas sp. MED121 TaxID=314277 RepID=UPI000068FE8A|nr:nitrite reductase small subunit NirD [Marinomonas sp. MED121]EAQ66840.1 nitrite reductase [NAD(P)H], small subunit [Marinomonas sp. MED121]